MKTRPALLCLAALLLASACGTPKIKGTEIDDTPDHRAILDLIEQYRTAYEARDASALLALCSPRYMEDGGTADTEDDYDFDGLKARLQGEDFARVLKARLSVSVNVVIVEKDRAYADLRVDTRYQTASLEEGKEPEWHMHSDDNRIRFAREDGAWKIIGGM